jgi:hypothetical protein
MKSTNRVTGKYYLLIDRLFFFHLLFLMSPKNFFSVCILFVSLLPVNAFSQDFYTIGLGGNIINARSFKKVNYHTRHGLNLSLGYEKIFSDPVGFRLELSLNTKEVNSLFSETSVDRIYRLYDDIEMLTLGIPLLTTLHFRRLSLEAGLYFDFLLHSEQREREIIYFPYGDVTEENTFSDRQTFTNPEMGVLFGLKVPVTRFFSLSTRYVQGFTPIGPEYRWVRMNMLQFAGIIRIGGNYTPSRLAPVSRAKPSTVQNYRTVTSQGIQRIDYTRVGAGRRIYFRIRSSDFSTVFVTDFTIQSSSGIVRISGTEKAIDDVVFPFTGSVRYTVTNNISRTTYESYFEFQINESGIWEINLVNN